MPLSWADPVRQLRGHGPSPARPPPDSRRPARAGLSELSSNRPRVELAREAVDKMIRSELLIEEFRFTCANCAHVWSVAYDVRHVEDGHGHERDYFFRHHQPSADPTAPQ